MVNFKANETSFEELAQVIKEAIDDVTKQEQKENHLVDQSLLNRCCFCGKPKFDILLPRGRKSLKVCLPCYTAAKAILETNHKWRV